jgi:hypothetical protein
MPLPTKWALTVAAFTAFPDILIVPTVVLEKACVAEGQS